MLFTIKNPVSNPIRLHAWVLLTLVLISVIAGCTKPNPGSGGTTIDSSIFGIPFLDVDAAIKLGLDAETLATANGINDTVREVNKTIKNGLEIGHETRPLADALIKEIGKANENLKNGIGLNSQTIATLEHAITVLDKGLKIGLDKATLEKIDEVAVLIDRQPEKWGKESRALVEALGMTGSKLAKEAADQSIRVIEQTQNSTQGIIAGGGEQFRCNADWVSNKVNRSVGEAAGMVVAGFLHSLGQGQKPTTSPAGLCAILPDRLNLEYADGKLVADKSSSIVTISGFNFAKENLPRVTVRDEKDTIYSSIEVTATVAHPYRMEINLQGKDLSKIAFGSKLVLAWSDDISTTQRNEKAFFIETLAMPVAKFESSSASGTVPFTVKFFDRSEGQPSEWFWNFGNGLTSNVQNPQVVYDKPGEYSVELTVSNRRGKDIKLAPQYVSVSVPAAPLVEFRADQRSGVAPLTVNFQDQSTATVGDIKDWRWDFGDGETSNERNPEHVYNGPGSYMVTVSLSVTDQYGTTASVSKTDYVTVKTPTPTPVTPTKTPTPNPTPQPLQIKLFRATPSDKSQRAESIVTVDEGWKILGGGAETNNDAAGYFVRESYPEDLRTWVARGTDFINPEAGRVTAYAIALYDPNDIWDVQLFTKPSKSSRHPQVTVSVGKGYTMTGGGVKATVQEPGQLLKASFPESTKSWRVESREHKIPNAGSITAYAIGVKPKRGNGYTQFPKVKRVCDDRLSEYPDSNHLVVSVSLGSEYTVLGGGAETHYKKGKDDAWNYLTASYPTDSFSWGARSQDHLIPSSATLEVCALGVKLGE